MSEPASLYHVLGIAPGASAAEIKAAYHRAAKTAHPDAGGSAALMARVNEAYQILSDPEARRAYDQAEAAASGAGRQPAGHPDHHNPQAEAAAARAEAAAVERGRRAWARRSAWELLRMCAPVAAGVIILTRLAASHITDSRALLGLHWIGFIPIYGFILSIVFLNDPPLRLVFADLARRYPTTRHERAAAVALVLAYFPLAAIWALWF